MKKKLLFLTIAVLCFTMFAGADTFTTYATRAQQNPSDFFDWSTIAPPGTQVTSPQLVTSFGGGNTASVGNTDGSPFLAEQEGVTYFSSFNPGESLIWTGNFPLFGFGGIGPMTISFANPVGTVGFGITADIFFSIGNTPFTAFLTAYDVHGNPLFSMIGNGLANGNEDGSDLFMGLGDLTGPNIASVQFTITNSLGAFADNDFAIDDLSIGAAGTTVPEPGSLVLLGSGLLVAVGAVRRKLAL